MAQRLFDLVSELLVDFLWELLLFMADLTKIHLLVARFCVRCYSSWPTSTKFAGSLGQNVGGRCCSSLA